MAAQATSISSSDKHSVNEEYAFTREPTYGDFRHQGVPSREPAQRVMEASGQSVWCSGINLSFRGADHPITRMSTTRDETVTPAGHGMRVKPVGKVEEALCKEGACPVKVHHVQDVKKAKGEVKITEGRVQQSLVDSRPMPEPVILGMPPMLRHACDGGMHGQKTALGVVEVTVTSDNCAMSIVENNVDSKAASPCVEMQRVESQCDRYVDGNSCNQQSPQAKRRTVFKDTIGLPNSPGVLHGAVDHDTDRVRDSDVLENVIVFVCICIASVYSVMSGPMTADRQNAADHEADVNIAVSVTRAMVPMVVIHGTKVKIKEKLMDYKLFE